MADPKTTWCDKMVRCQAADSLVVEADEASGHAANGAVDQNMSDVPPANPLKGVQMIWRLRRGDDKPIDLSG
jgi:hypothetical protein